ncbi:MAG: hypothetical protein ACXAEN_27320, partial [Candidatus Thorarchaeota archaeon]
SDVLTDADGNELIEETKERLDTTIKKWTEDQFVEEIQRINDQIQELQQRKTELAQQQIKFRGKP